MTRVLHVASLPETLQLFCEPFRQAAERDGFDFSYLDGRQLGEERALLRRGYAAVSSWPHHRLIRHEVQAAEPDIIHVHTPATALALLPVLRPLQIPKLYVARGGLDEGRSALVRRLFEYADPLFWKQWDHVAVVNRTQLEAATQRDQSVSRVSAGGVPPPRVQPPYPHPRPGRRSLNLLWVGRLVADKQPGAAWRVARSLHAAGYPVQITFVGAPLDGDRSTGGLERELRGSGIAHLTGWVDDVTPYYREADLLLVTSRREGYGRTPLEAAAFAVPTVGYRTQGTQESIADAGGWMIEQGDERSLERHIREFWESPAHVRTSHRERVRQAAARMEEHDVWQEWRRIYESIL